MTALLFPALVACAVAVIGVVAHVAMRELTTSRHHHEDDTP